MDIIICTLKYPNDPKGNLTPHQHFVGFLSENILELYSISSLQNKEYRIYDLNNNVKEEYFILSKDKQIKCNLRVPSFIDCTKAYKINVSFLDLSKLTSRYMPLDIRQEIEVKINEMKNKGKHIIYVIESEEFKQLNPKLLK